MRSRLKRDEREKHVNGSPRVRAEVKERADEWKGCLFSAWCENGVEGLEISSSKWDLSLIFTAL